MKLLDWLFPTSTRYIAHLESEISSLRREKDEMRVQLTRERDSALLKVEKLELYVLPRQVTGLSMPDALDKRITKANSGEFPTRRISKWELIKAQHAAHEEEQAEAERDKQDGIQG